MGFLERKRLDFYGILGVFREGERFLFIEERSLGLFCCCFGAAFRLVNRKASREEEGGGDYYFFVFLLLGFKKKEGFSTFYRPAWPALKEFLGAVEICLAKIHFMLIFFSEFINKKFLLSFIFLLKINISFNKMLYFV